MGHTTLEKADGLSIQHWRSPRTFLRVCVSPHTTKGMCEPSHFTKGMCEPSHFTKGMCGPSHFTKGKCRPQMNLMILKSEQLLKILGAVWKKLPPHKRSSGAYTVLRGSVTAPSGFLGQTLGCKPWGLRPLVFAALGLPLENPSGGLTLPLSTV